MTESNDRNGAAAKPVAVAKKRSEKTVAFRLLAGIVVPFMGAVSKLHLHNPEKVPTEGAFILSPNHYSNIDPIVMALAVWKLGRAPRFMAKASLFKVPVVGAALRSTGQIPVERSGSMRGRAPIEAAERLVDSGQCVIIYPEGTLTRDPDLWPMRGKSGAVRMALEQQIPVIPSAHWGTQNLMGRYSNKIRFFPRTQINIRFGDPVDLSEFYGKPLDSATLRAATTKVMAEITLLLEELRGETAPEVRWNPADHNQSEHGKF